MEDRLIPVNAFIALASPNATSWPNPLFQVGYSLEGLETPAGTSSGRVVIDCIAFNPTTNRFVLAECKSGNNIEPAQAQRYRDADPRDLIRLTGVTLTTPGEQTTCPMYVCLLDSVDRILLGLREAGCHYPVLAIGERELILQGAQPTDPAIADAFSTPIPIGGPPPVIIRVDDESGVDEYGRVVGSALIAEMTQGKEHIGIAELAARAIPHLHLFGAGYRSRLEKQVERAAQRLCDSSPDTFQFRPRTATRDYPVVKVVDSPEHADPRGRTQRYQAIKARLVGATPQREDARQASLFDDIDLAAELEKVDTEDLEATDSQEEG